MEEARANVRFIPHLTEGELRLDGRGKLRCIGEADDYVAVWRVGTDHSPFFMPLSEWEKLPKIDQ